MAPASVARPMRCQIKLGGGGESKPAAPQDKARKCGAPAGGGPRSGPAHLAPARIPTRYQGAARPHSRPDCCTILAPPGRPVWPPVGRREWRRPDLHTAPRMPMAAGHERLAANWIAPGASARAPVPVGSSRRRPISSSCLSGPVINF